MNIFVANQISFHSMAYEEDILSEETASGGEIEIEKIPARVVEVRAKKLVPIFDHLQPPNFQQTRFGETIR